MFKILKVKTHLTWNTVVLSVDQVIYRRGELVLGHVGLRNNTTIVLVERTLRLSVIPVHRSALEAQTTVVVGPASVQAFL